MKYILLGLTFGLTGCVITPSPQTPSESISTSSDEAYDYAQGLMDAKNVEVWEASSELSAVNIDNPSLQWKLFDGDKHILVSTWKSETKYYVPSEGSKYYNTGKYDIWVTLAPELQNLCSKKNFGSSVGLDDRIKQLLGLTPESNYKAFVEFWVKPKDLFRPCPDGETTDTQCSLSFPPGTTLSHKEWIDNQRKTNNYPWTQLGYTYDWNENTGNHVGLSEFVIKQNKDIVVAGIYDTQDYCSKSF